MLLAENNRSKAYLQNLIKNKFIPESVILLYDNDINLPENTKFDIRETVKSTLDKYQIQTKIIRTLNINSDEVVKSVQNLPTDYVVYSGPGGSLLRKDLLSTGKHFLHVHPGVLPNFKGSTTIYYSLLEKKSVGASVIILKQKIDCGPILFIQKYKHETTDDLDRVFDPCLRARTLINFFTVNVNKKIKPLQIENTIEGRTYYIIHPLLKHLSILKSTKI